MKNLLIAIIDLYQRTLSPDEGWFRGWYPGGFCKYEPHCSKYGKIAIMKHGALKGSGLFLWRLLRCNPWSKGGVDEIPK